MTVQNLCGKGLENKSQRMVWKYVDFIYFLGAVMRTSILGVINFDNIGKVIENTKSVCMVSVMTT